MPRMSGHGCMPLAAGTAGIAEGQPVMAPYEKTSGQSEPQKAAAGGTSPSACAEEAARGYAEPYAVFESIPDGLMVADAETGRCLRANAAMCAMLGYTEEELRGLAITDVHPAEALPELIEKFQAHFRLPVARSENIPMRRKDGRVFWADITSSRIVYQGRECLLNFFRDVTQRKQVEEALQQSEEKYRTLVERLPDAVILAEFDGRVTFASRRALEMYGAARAEDVLGRNPLEFVAAEEQLRVAANLRRTRTEGVIRDEEYWFLRRDGSRFLGEASAAAIHDHSQSPTSFVAVIRDTTARKQAEAALRQSHEELRAIYEGMFDGLLILDLESKRIVRANAAICRMLGYREAELVSKSYHEIHPPDEIPILDERLAAYARGEALGHRVGRLIRKDGSILYADSVGNALVYGGRPCVAGFFQDFTERKKAREALERERRTLKHMLRASDHERQLIAYDIHDGLAQHLAGAIMQFDAFEHLQHNKPKQAADAFQAGMTMLRQGHFEARRLISGVRPPILDESGVVAAIAHLVNDQRFPGGPKIEFRSRVAFDRLIPLLENAIYRIVQEALSNACRHAQSALVRISLLQRGAQLRIEVRDWGRGFDPKTARENRFGLEGIRERSRVLGGKSRIRSKPGEGTSIVVELPVVERDPEP
jgi:PAS domain S-box-containing protein